MFIYLITSIAISLLMLFIFYLGVPEGSFLFPSDAFLVLSKYEIPNLFVTQQFLNFGSANTTILLVGFFDRLYFSFLESRMLLYFLQLFASIFLPFLGFVKLDEYFNREEKVNLTVCFAIALWYAFNSYAQVYWHGIGLAPTLFLSYVLAPLAFYYFYTAISGLGSTRRYLVTSILLFLMSFAVYLFGVFLIFASAVVFLEILLRKRLLKETVLSLLKLSVFYAPFLSLHILIPYDMLTSQNISTNLSGGETYGLLQGGLLYPFLMWFSWGIYTIWKPRSIYPFHEYFKSVFYLFASVVPYLLIIYGLLVKKKKALFYIFMAVFLFMLFFAKGPQPPFGEIYTYLIEHVLPFRLFRSPDNKFGFGAVLAISFLLIYSYRSIKKKLFIALLLGSLVLQSYPLFSGIALKGANKGNNFTDRVVRIPDSYRQLEDFVNADDGEFGFILPIPPPAYSHFSLDGDLYIGQDIVSKLVKYPFFYTVSDAGTYVQTFEIFDEILSGKNYSEFKNYPIKYILVRSDIVSDKSLEELGVNQLYANYSVVFENKDFILFRNFSMKPLFGGAVSDFEIISPVKFKVTVDKDQSDLLIFNQSFNSNWKIYKVDENEVGNALDVKYLFRPSLFDQSHSLYNGFANSWDLTGEESGTYLVFFKTQSVFYLGLYVVLGYLCVATIYLLRKNPKE